MSIKHGEKTGRIISFIMTVCLMITVLSPAFYAGRVRAEGTPSASNVSTNLWGSGGQISFDLSGCNGFLTITVVVEFNADVKSPSGWGFDTYTASGKQVTAVVQADG